MDISLLKNGKYQINTRVNGTQQKIIKIKNIYFDTPDTP